MNFSLLFHAKLWLLALVREWLHKSPPTEPVNPLLQNWQTYKATLENISASDIANANVRTYPLEPIRSTHTCIKEAISYNASVLSMLRNLPELSSRDIIHVSQSTPLSEYLLDDKGNYLPDTAQSITVFHSQCLDILTIISQKLTESTEYQHNVYLLNMYLATLSNTLEDLLVTNQ